MRKWEPPLGSKGGSEAAEAGYTSSEDEDELTRLKPVGNSGTSTSGGSGSVGGGGHHPAHGGQQQQPHKGGHAGGHRGHGQRNNYLQSQSEATSPGNDSDNTYAEALLVQNPQQQPQMQRYGQYICLSVLIEFLVDKHLTGNRLAIRRLQILAWSFNWAIWSRAVFALWWSVAGGVTIFHAELSQIEAICLLCKLLYVEAGLPESRIDSRRRSQRSPKIRRNGQW